MAVRGEVSGEGRPSTRQGDGGLGAGEVVGHMPGHSECKRKTNRAEPAQEKRRG